MNQHQSKGLEFEIEKKDEPQDQPSKDDPSSSGVIRKSFRIPSDDPNQIFINIDRVRYEVINFDIKGLSFRTTDPEPFKSKDIIKKIELIFRDKKFPVSGKIIHVTPFDEEHPFHGSYLCGLQIIHGLPETVKQIEKIIIEARRELMTENLSR